VDLNWRARSCVLFANSAAALTLAASAEFGNTAPLLLCDEYNCPLAVTDVACAAPISSISDQVEFVEQAWIAPAMVALKESIA
jgi:hypothetical protein